MKHIYCDLHMFDMTQSIFVVDDTTGEKEYITMVKMDELPEIISAICATENLDKVVLSGNSVFGAAVAEDICHYSRHNYNKNNIEVEVLK